MPFKPAPTRGSAPFDKSKKPAFRHASQVTNARDINTIGSYVSTNGVLSSVKKAMQAAKGGNFILSSADFRAETDSRILQTRIQQPISTIPGTGDYDGYVIQYSSNGMVNWAMAFGGDNVDYGYSVGYDNSGNFIVVGNGLSSNFRVTDRTGVLRLSTSVTQYGSQYGGQIIKYDSNGTPLWISYYYGGGGYFKSYNDVTTDSAGNIYVIGNAQGGIGYITNANGTLFPSNGNFTFSSSGTHIVKYSPSGFVQWVTKVDGGGNNDGANGICIDSNGNVSMVGYFLTDCYAYNADGSTFSPSTGYGTGSGMFAVQYSSAGTVNWFARITSSNGGFGNGLACTSDSSGNVNAIFGIYNTSITIYNKNGSTGTSFRTINNINGYGHGYIVQYSSTGNVNWASMIAGSTNGPQDITLGVGYTDSDTDTLGNVISCGRYSGGYLYIENSDGSKYLELKGLNINLASASTTGGYTTYTTTSAHGFTAGQQYLILGNSNWMHDFSTPNLGQIYDVPTPTTFRIFTGALVTEGTTSTGGAVYDVGSSTTGSVTTYYTKVAHNLKVGQSISVRGTLSASNDVTLVNITSIPTPTTFTINNPGGTTYTSRGQVYTQPSNYYSNGFIIKYNSSGFVQWHVVFSGADGSDSHENSAMTLSVDRNTNNINVCGHFTTGSITFYNANGSVGGKLFNTNRGSKDLYIVQYSPEGNVNWAALSGRSASDLVYGSDTDVNGNFTITGAAYPNLVTYDKTGLPASPNIYAHL
jgi:hypothetical protein